MVFDGESSTTREPSGRTARARCAAIAVGDDPTTTATGPAGGFRFVMGVPLNHPCQ